MIGFIRRLGLLDKALYVYMVFILQKNSLSHIHFVYRCDFIELISNVAD